jgi:hypothetical protein
MNVRPEGAQLFHAAGHDEVDIRFSEFNEGAKRLLKITSHLQFCPTMFAVPVPVQLILNWRAETSVCLFLIQPQFSGHV